MQPTTPAPSGPMVVDEFVQPSRLNARMLAAELGMPEDLVSDLVYGQTIVDVGMGTRMHRYLNLPARWWIRAQGAIKALPHRGTALEQRVSSTPAPFVLSVKGATPEQLQRGCDAAWRVFRCANVSPHACARAALDREGCDVSGTWYRDYDIRLAALWGEAIEAAYGACCEGWPEIPADRDFRLL